jgi:hypothetical protein
MAMPAFAPLPDLAPGATAPPTNGLMTQDSPMVVPGAPVVVKPVIVTATGNFVPEIGQSLTTAQQTCMNRMAVQIVSLMEKPW